MTRAHEIIERMRRHAVSVGLVGKGAKLGVLSAFCSKSTVKETGGENGHRLLHQIMTTDDVDLDDEVVDPDGLDTSVLEKNRKVFLDHRYEFEHVVGAIDFVAKWGTRGLKAQINVIRGLTFSDDVWKVATTCGIGASIGFEALRVSPPDKNDPERWQKARSVVRKARVFELSLTCLPCNISSQTLSAVEDDRKRAQVEELVTKSAIRRETAEALGIVRGPRLRIVVGR